MTIKSGICPTCRSEEIYVSNSPYPDSMFVKSSLPSFETFTTSADLCLDCGHLEIYVRDMCVARLERENR